MIRVRPWDLSSSRISSSICTKQQSTHAFVSVSDVPDFMYKRKTGQKEDRTNQTTRQEERRVKNGFKKTVFNWFVNQFRKKLVVK